MSTPLNLLQRIRALFSDAPMAPTAVDQGSATLSQLHQFLVTYANRLERFDLLITDFSERIQKSIANSSHTPMTRADSFEVLTKEEEVLSFEASKIRRQNDAMALLYGQAMDAGGPDGVSRFATTGPVNVGGVHPWRIIDFQDAYDLIEDVYERVKRRLEKRKKQLKDYKDQYPEIGIRPVPYISLKE